MMTLRPALIALSLSTAMLSLVGCESVHTALGKKHPDLVYLLSPREGFLSPLQAALKPACPALEFSGHSFTLTRAHQRLLDQVAKEWKEHEKEKDKDKTQAQAQDQKPRYLIAGYAPPGLPDDYARSLSERRALAVRQHLIENGMEISNLQTIGFGSDALPSGPSSAIVVIYQQP